MSGTSDPHPGDRTIADPHVPEPLPIELDHRTFSTILAEASYELGRLHALLQRIPDAGAARAPSSAVEATDSSRIEGTRSTVRDVFKREAGASTPYADVEELINYRQAMESAEKQLRERPLSLNVIRNLHRTLLSGVRGSGPVGQFREHQVVIGPADEPDHVPAPPEKVPELMHNLEEYLHESDASPLVITAVFHYQFEAIHPFADGNGRIGRMLIPLILFERGVLDKPVLYMSGYFERNRSTYLEELNRADETGQYEEWVQFFLKAIKHQTEQTIRLVEEIEELRNRVRDQVSSVKSPYISEIVDQLFEQPVFRKRDVVDWIDAHRTTAYRLLDKLEELEIIDEMFTYEGTPYYWFSELVLHAEGYHGD